MVNGPNSCASDSSDETDPVPSALLGVDYDDDIDTIDELRRIPLRRSIGGALDSAPDNNSPDCTPSKLRNIPLSTSVSEVLAAHPSAWAALPEPRIQSAKKPTQTSSSPTSPSSRPQTREQQSASRAKAHTQTSFPSPASCVAQGTSQTPQPQSKSQTPRQNVQSTKQKEETSATEGAAEIRPRREFPINPVNAEKEEEECRTLSETRGDQFEPCKEETQGESVRGISTNTGGGSCSRLSPESPSTLVTDARAEAQRNNDRDILSGGIEGGLRELPKESTPNGTCNRRLDEKTAKESITEERSSIKQSSPEKQSPSISKAEEFETSTSREYGRTEGVRPGECQNDGSKEDECSLGRKDGFSTKASEGASVAEGEGFNTRESKTAGIRESTNCGAGEAYNVKKERSSRPGRQAGTPSSTSTQEEGSRGEKAVSAEPSAKQTIRNTTQAVPKPGASTNAKTQAEEIVELQREMNVLRAKVNCILSERQRWSPWGMLWFLVVVGLMIIVAAFVLEDAGLLGAPLPRLDYSSGTLI